MVDNTTVKLWFVDPSNWVLSLTKHSGKVLPSNLTLLRSTCRTNISESGVDFVKTEGPGCSMGAVAPDFSRIENYETICTE